MFECSSAKKIIRLNIQELYANHEDVQKFEDELEKADEEGHPLLDYRLQVKGMKGRKFWISIDCHLIKDSKGNILGREGTIRDITDTVQLERIVGTKEDVHKFVHPFIAPLESIHSTGEVLMEEMGRIIGLESGEREQIKLYELSRDFLGTLKRIQEISGNLVLGLNELISAIRRNRQVYDTRDRELAMKKLESLTIDLENIVKGNIVENILEIRELQRNISEELIRLRKVFRGHHEVMDCIHKNMICIKELDNLYILQLVERMLSEAKVTYHNVETLKSYLLKRGEVDYEPPYKFERRNLYKCIREIINIYQADALLKNVTIRLSGYVPEIEMAEDPIRSMLSCLVQNAVKYSFKRKGGFIDIRVEDLGSDVKIEIEDYGVGISPEEIESGIIFEYGYRGKYSDDWDRIGSGIGLAEAKRIVEKHNGEIFVRSKPVVPFDTPIKKITPHKTTVTVILPKTQPKEEVFL